MNFRTSDNSLIFHDGTVVELPFPITKLLEFDEVIVVIVTPMPGDSYSENVFAISRNGHILWQIERIPETVSNPSNVYNDMWKQSDNVVSVWNWNCWTVDVDVRTGKVLKKVYRK